MSLLPRRAARRPLITAVIGGLSYGLLFRLMIAFPGLTPRDGRTSS